MSQINTAGVINSQQMYMLLQTGLRTMTGKSGMLNGGMSSRLVSTANLKQSLIGNIISVHLAARAWAALVKPA